jgi:LacI family transcriptional regulator
VGVTIREVATRADVSPMTVSRVVNASPRVSPETRRRVESAIGELGYVPNRLARGLSQRKTGTLGVLVPDIANPFFTNVVRGAEEVAWRSGFHVLLCNTDGDLERERGYLQDMVAFRVEGLLIAPVSDSTRPMLRAVRRNGVPFVLVDRSIGGYDCDVVQGDSIVGARRLVDHLLGLGHRRIALVTERSDISTARDRLLGYRQALEDAGVPFDEELVAVSSAIHTAGATDATRGLLSLADPPTAIFAVNNVTAIGAAVAVREAGLSVPEDLALVCFDDIEHASTISPFLTVMAQPAETFGTLAAQLLLDRIAGRATDRARTVVLPPDLIVRRSSGEERLVSA